jgi:hypothetical protein
VLMGLYKPQSSHPRCSLTFAPAACVQAHKLAYHSVQPFQLHQAPASIPIYSKYPSILTGMAGLVSHRFLQSLVLHVCGVEAFGQMSAEIEALPGDLCSLYQNAVLPTLELRFEGRTWGILDQIARCAAAATADSSTGGGGEEDLGGTEEGIVAKVLSSLCDAGHEGLYVADVPVPMPSPHPFKYIIVST